ncbi:hypothetical protein H311_01349 [Anncaliia algerae PRA109]|nr:hypothetical protein H311_01349 [Anncaliia algerae PRA109]
MVDIGTNIKSIQRRFHNIDYSDVPYKAGYEETEAKYRKIRDAMLVYMERIETLMNYEHGGKTMKTIMHGLTTIGNRLQTSLFKTDDFYIQTGLVLEEMDKLMDEDASRKSYATALKKIGEAKEEFNRTLVTELDNLKEQAKIAGVIDYCRVKLKNTRYDLAKLKKKFDADPNSKADLENKFNGLVEDTEKQMKNFLGKGEDGSNSVSQSIKNILKAHFKFSETECEVLKESHSKIK